MGRKLKSKFSLVICAAAAAVAAPLLAGCGNNATQPTTTIKEPVEIAQVNEATITYDGSTLSWGSVLHADTYEIRVNGVSQTSTTNSLEVAVKENVTFEIAGKVNDGNADYKSCTTFTSKQFTYKGQIEVSTEGRNYTWEAVEGCDGYKICENDSIYQGYQQETTYKMVAVKNEDGTQTSKFKVKAVFSDPTYFTSWSEEKVVTILSTPENVQYDGTLVTWDTVKNAKSYVVTVTGTDAEGNPVVVKQEEVTKTSYALSVNGDDDGLGDDVAIVTGSFVIHITAKGDAADVNTLDSDDGTYSFSYVNNIPNIQAVDGLVKWDKIPNADYYRVRINGLNEYKVETNYFEISEDVTVEVMPAKYDGSLYSTWSPQTNIKFLAQPYLKWVEGSSSLDAKLTWEFNEAGDKYETDGASFSIVAYKVTTSTTVEEGTLEPVRTIDGVSKDNYQLKLSEVRALIGNVKGNLYAIRVVACKNNATSLYSEPIYFYNVGEPSAFTESSDIIKGETTQQVHLYFNDVQIPDYLKPYNVDIQYQTKLDGEDIISHETGADIDLPVNADGSGMSRILTFKSVSKDHNKCLENNGTRVVFFFPKEDKEVVLYRLAKPVLKLEGDNMTWAAVPKAAGYRINVDYLSEDVEDKDYVANDTNFDLSALRAGEKCTITVSAIGNGDLVLSSAASSPVTVQRLAEPKITSITKDGSGITITWSKVDNAQKYKYVYDGTTYDAGTSLSVTLTTDKGHTTGSQFYVYAEADDSEKFITSPRSEIKDIYKLDAPSKVELKDTPAKIVENADGTSTIVHQGTRVVWNSVNPVDGGTIKYRVLLNDTYNLGVTTNTYMDLYDESITTLLLNSCNEKEVYVSVQAFIEGGTDARYFDSEYTTSDHYTRLNSPANVEMNVHTGTITWTYNEGHSLEYFQGFQVIVRYVEHKEVEKYIVHNRTFTPELRYDNETMEITVISLGDNVQNISSNPYDNEYNNIGCTAKTVKLANLENTDDYVAYTVDGETNQIIVTVDEGNMPAAYKADKLLGSGYGVSISGIRHVIRRYFSDEALYNPVADSENLYSYKLENGDEVFYNSVTDTYKLVTAYAAVGTYELDIRQEGGNFSANCDDYESEVICYLSSDYTGSTTTIYVLPQILQTSFKLNSDGTKVQFENLNGAVKYEYTVQYFRTGGKALTEKTAEAVMDAEAGKYSYISIADRPENATSVRVTVRALGDNKTVFDSVKVVTVEIIIPNVA